MITNVIRSRRPDAEPVVLMGSFMPFAGVRYYKLLTNVDAALGQSTGRVSRVAGGAVCGSAEHGTGSGHCVIAPGPTMYTA